MPLQLLDLPVEVFAEILGQSLLCAESFALRHSHLKITRDLTEKYISDFLRFFRTVLHAQHPSWRLHIWYPQWDGDDFLSSHSPNHQLHNRNTKIIAPYARFGGSFVIDSQYFFDWFVKYESLMQSGGAQTNHFRQLALGPNVKRISTTVTLVWSQVVNLWIQESSHFLFLSRNLNLEALSVGHWEWKDLRRTMLFHSIQSISFRNSSIPKDAPQHMLPDMLTHLTLTRLDVSGPRALDLLNVLDLPVLNSLRLRSCPIDSATITQMVQNRPTLTSLLVDSVPILPNLPHVSHMTQRQWEDVDKKHADGKPGKASGATHYTVRCSRRIVAIDDKAGDGVDSETTQLTRSMSREF
ncbi:hypothetical protein GGX14DRAFT_386253 [Mycena pura]|uniref:Uncharacterized protein n=1 Tax=Mycena pura TaxID=153505 RepID=A0AAD6YNX3_9AGAR|nr:hypothetical protein GGX14DRAFT_386253 [Mycena pura]